MPVAIITGANKGIGLETCRALALSGHFKTVYLTSRNVDRGLEALKDVQQSVVGQSCTVKHHQLDIADEASIQTFKTYIVEQHQTFDVLVQNAGFAYKNAATEAFEIQAKDTLAINFWGTLNMLKAFYPIASENARIVNVSSMCSQSAMFGFTPRFGNPIGRELHSINIALTEERLTELATQFVSDCEQKKNVEVGWPQTAYGVSKLLVNGLTRIYGKRAHEDGRGVLVNCCCPGYVKTDMSSHSENASKVPKEGCESSVWLATLPAGIQGPQGTYVADA